MAKKKSSGKKADATKPKKSNRRGLPPNGPAQLQAIVDQMLREQSEMEDSPQGQAQELCWQAFDEDAPHKRVKLANQALALDPECADAYCLLAAEADSDDESLRLYSRGVSAGLKTIGEEPFREFIGHFWGIFETRPYMRALQGVAECLWDLGRHEESIRTLRDMLRLNPADNQGMRYVLLSHLLFVNHDDEARELINDYPGEGSPDWCFSQALLSFRKDGDTPQAQRLLRNAKKTNKFVPEYLLGHKQLPPYPPDMVELGRESEAQSFAFEFMRHWRNTSGALPWMRDVLNVKAPKPPQEKSDAKKWARLKSRLLGLDQDESEVWHVDLCDLSGEGQTPNLWALFTLSPTRMEVLAGDFYEEKPMVDKCLEVLAKTMLGPDDEEPRRPGLIRVGTEKFANEWRGRLAEVDVDCVYEADLQDVAEYARLLSETASQQFAAKDSPPATEEELSALAQFDEVWQADVRLLASFVGERGTPERPWSALVGNPQDGTILGQNLTTDQPAASWLAETLARTMSTPSVGEPRRPTLVQVATVEQLQACEAWLNRIGVACAVSENQELLDFLYGDLAKHLAGDGVPQGLLEVPGVDPDLVGGLFEAAAEFYRVAPWRIAPPDVAIEIKSDAFPSGPYGGMVMGQNGVMQGLALYENLGLLRRMLAGQMSDEQSSRENCALTLFYGEAFDIPPGDLYDLERLGWALAGPEAYPNIVYANPGMSIRRPLAWEIKLMEVSLRGIKKYVTSLESEPREYEFNTGGGFVRLQLRWMK